MIVAQTGMERMPERCGECGELFATERTYCGKVVDWSGYCNQLGAQDGKVTNRDARLSNCPLREIDETLKAQLECAEARIRKLDRLLNFEEVHTPDEHH